MKPTYASLLFLLSLLIGFWWSSWSPDLTIYLRSEGSGSPVFFIPHSDETAALETARRFISAAGQGTIVWMNCGGNRRCRWIDPNRYFGFCSNGQRANVMKTYRDEVFSYFADQPVVIALHNNQGCSRTICANQPYKGARALASDSGPSDVVIFNGPEAEPSGPRLDFSRCLTEHHISQMYEKSGEVDDCSMSEAATRMGHYYFNLDTELAHGADLQFRLLNQAMDCASRAFRPKFTF